MGWTLALFASTIGFDFVDYDDREALLDHSAYRGLGPSHLRWMFTTFHMGHYQPLTWMSLGLDSLIGRTWFRDAMDPRPYHTTNVLLHTLSALLVFVIARRIFSAAFSIPTGGRLDAVSSLAALWFAIHPLRAESVAWITERRDVLSSFLLLATVWLYLKSHDADRSRSAFLRAGCLLAYFLSLLSRAMGVTLPVILLLLDLVVLRRRRGDGDPTRCLDWRRLLVEKIPFFVIAAPFIILAPIAQREVGAAWSWEEHGLIARIAQMCYGLVHYLWKTAIPVGLSPIYELARPVDPFASKYLISFVVLVAMSAIVWTLRRKCPSLPGAAACYVVLLLPVSGLFQSGDQEVADRYSYLPGVVLAVLLGGALLRLLARRPARKLPVLGAGFVAAIVLSVLTARQCAIWRNATALWTYAQGVAPNSAIAQSGYANILIEQGRYAEAEVHARRALQIVPRNWQAHQHLWKSLQSQGNNEALIAALHDSLQLGITPEKAHTNLGNAYVRQSAYDRAAAEYRAAIALRPDYAKAHANLTFVLLRLGDLQKAEEHGRAAVAADPNFAMARLNLALVLERLGKLDEAKAAYREALRLDPNSAEARRAMERLSD